MLERGKKRILRRIGGEIVIAEDAQGGVEERILIMQDERIEGIEVAALCGLDEGGFVHEILLYSNCNRFVTQYLSYFNYQIMQAQEYFL